MSNSFDTPLTVDSSAAKWALAMSGSMKLAEMVEENYFFNTDVTMLQRASATAAAGRITSTASRLHRSHWHDDPTSRHWRVRMLSELEGTGSDLGRVSLRR